MIKIFFFRNEKDSINLFIVDDINNKALADYIVQKCLKRSINIIGGSPWNLKNSFLFGFGLLTTLGVKIILINMLLNLDHSFKK